MNDKKGPLCALSLLLLVEDEALTYCGCSGEQRCYFRFCLPVLSSPSCVTVRDQMEDRGPVPELLLLSSPHPRAAHFYHVQKAYAMVSQIKHISGQHLQELTHKHGQSNNKDFLDTSLFPLPLFKKGLS